MRANVIPLQELVAAFYYDETSKSCLRLRVDKYRGRKHTTLVHKAHDEVGCLHKVSGYYVTTHNGIQQQCHRIVYALVHHVDLLPNDEVDHEDGDRANNKKANLRKVEPAINAKNKRKYANNTTGQAGIHINWSRGGRSYYVATIGSDTEISRRYFPRHSMGDEAALAAAIAFRAQELARLNAPGAGYTERHGK